MKEAREIFAARHDRSQFIFFDPYNEDRVGVISEDSHTVYLQNVDLIIEILTTFGSIIEKIEFYFDKISTIDAKNIINHINTLNESLAKLRLINCKEDVLDGLNNKFVSVVTLEYSSSSTESLQCTECKKLSEIFPNVKYLYIGYTRISDWEIFNGTFPKLNDFYVELPPQEGKNADETQIASFLNKNMQIKRLEIRNTTLKLLNETNNILPTIDVLTLKGLSQNYSDNGGKNIGLNRVKFLHIERIDDDKIPTNILFQKLNGFRMNVRHLNENWKKFMHDQINPLGGVLDIHIITQEMSKEQFRFISDLYQECSRMEIDNESKFTAADVVDFLENVKKIDRLYLNIKMLKSEQKYLAEMLKDDWNIEFKPLGPHVKISIRR